jgi:hypothetical protein
MTYQEGYDTGYKVGPYGVAPDGNWGGGYDADRMVAGGIDYRNGLREGRAARIDDMGDKALDPTARNREALEAYERHRATTDGADQ